MAVRHLAATTAVAAALAALPASAATADSRPVREGGDLARCATYAETDLVFIGTKRDRVRRILDTHGRRVPAAEMDAAIAGFPGAGPVEQRQGREVRKYRTCPEDGVPAEFFVEFNHQTGRAIALLWV